MRAELRERRKRTWRLLVEGHRHTDVCERIATEYDVTKSTVSTDISRMDDWLGELGVDALSTGVSRLRELRQNRAEYYQMANKARREDNPELELRIRRRIDQNVEKDVELAERLGLTQRESSEAEQSFGGELDEKTREAFDALTTNAGPSDLDVESRNV